MITPLAFQLYREYLSGKSVAELAKEYRLPFHSVQVRLHAATATISLRSAPPTRKPPFEKPVAA